MKLAKAAAPPINVPPSSTLETSVSRAPWKIILKPAQMIAIVTTATEIVTRMALTLVTVVLTLSKPGAEAADAAVATTAAAVPRIHRDLAGGQLGSGVARVKWL